MRRLPRPRPIVLVTLAGMLAATLLLAAAVTGSATVGRLDLAAVGLVRASGGEPVTDWIVMITTLGATHVIVTVTAVAVAVLAAVRHWRGALMLALSIAATEATVTVVKALVSRPRPPGGEAVAESSGFSFPSGHAATAVAVYAVLAFLAARSCRGPARIAVALAGALVVLAVGASRVYLGVHYPTDVVAGWLTGGALALGSWALVARIGSPVGPARST